MFGCAVDLPERFWARVEKTETCWLWTGALSKNGYGMFGVKGLPKYVHRLTYGPVPVGLELDHLCRVRHCCNPAHLEAVTHAENVRRGAAYVTHCLHGHLYDEANTYRHPSGRRYCRTCQKARHRAARGGEANG